MVDADEAEFGRNRPVDVGIAADLRLTLDALAAAVPAGGPRPGAAHGRRRLRDKEGAEQAKQATLAASDATPDHPLPARRRAGGGDGRADLPGRGRRRRRDLRVEDRAPVAAGPVARPGPLGVLGVGPPFALAAKALHPEWRVLLLSGDGAFGLNGMELETAVRFGLPLVCVVGNDGGWGMIRSIQQSFYGRERLVATSLPLTRYDRLVEALGGEGETIEDPRTAPAGARAGPGLGPRGRASMLSSTRPPTGARAAAASRSSPRW